MNAEFKKNNARAVRLKINTGKDLGNQTRSRLRDPIGRVCVRGPLHRNAHQKEDDDFSAVRMPAA